jgi:hypothetical protein
MIGVTEDGITENAITLGFFQNQKMALPENALT